MGKGYTNGNENIYFRARKQAAIHNEKLYSRRGAAEMLGVSESTLADYELGITKSVPVDKVVLMADLYNHPEFKNKYCKEECPIGKKMPIATKVTAIEGVTLRLVREFDTEHTGRIVKRMIKLSANGVIAANDRYEFESLLKTLDEIALVLSEMRLVGEKILKGKC